MRCNVLGVVKFDFSLGHRFLIEDPLFFEEFKRVSLCAILTGGRPSGCCAYSYFVRGTMGAHIITENGEICGAPATPTGAGCKPCSRLTFHIWM